MGQLLKGTKIKLRCPTIGRHAPLDRANGLLETRTSGVEPESPHKRNGGRITLLYQLSYWPPMNGNQVGLEPTTHGLSGNCVLLYDHLKLQSQRLPPPKGTASHPRRGRGAGDLVASLGLTTKKVSVSSRLPPRKTLQGRVAVLSDSRPQGLITSVQGATPGPPPSSLGFFFSSNRFACQRASWHRCHK